MELAAALAGVTLITANPSFTARELRFVLEQSRAEAVYFVSMVRGTALGPVVETACADLPAIEHRILLTDPDALFAGETAGALRATVPDDIVQIQYTSGTTGFPKGARLHQKGLIQNGYDAVGRWGAVPGDTMLIMMPLFHTAGCALSVLGGLARATTLLLAPGYDPAMLVRVIEHELLALLMGVPTMIVGLIDEAGRSGGDVGSVQRDGRWLGGGA